MPEKKTRGSHAAPRRRLRPSVKIVLGLLAVLLLVLAGIRVYRWSALRDETRVIVLVNPWNSVDNSGFRPRLKTVEDVQVDSSCAGALEQMLADCRATGTPITLTAGFRTQDEQLSFFDCEVSRQMMAGRNADSA